MPLELKRTIVAEAAVTGTNVNDVAVGALADFYEVPFTPSGRRCQADENVSKVILHMSDRLKAELQRDALRDRTNMSYTAVVVLSRMLGVDGDLPPAHRRSLARRLEPRRPRRSLNGGDDLS
jgi:hypothetical protein